MKQSLEKLHRGMIPPEVQQQSDPETDTLEDQWPANHTQVLNSVTGLVSSYPGAATGLYKSHTPSTSWTLGRKQWHFASCAACLSWKSTCRKLHLTAELLKDVEKRETSFSSSGGLESTSNRLRDVISLHNKHVFMFSCERIGRCFSRFVFICQSGYWTCSKLCQTITVFIEQTWIVHVCSNKDQCRVW